MLDVRRWVFSSMRPKKVPPPTPDGREGRLFPPEQSSKSAQLLTELNRCRNKNFHKLCCSYGAIVNRNPAGRNFPLEGSLRAAFCPNFSPVAEADNARFNFTCAICDRKNRAASPDHS